MLFRHLAPRLHRLRRDERGVALAAVIGVMALGVLLTTVVATSVISGIGQTTANRAGVQSQAAADAGLAAAKAGLDAGTCAAQSPSGVYKSTTGTNPNYSATIWNGTSASTMTKGCPADGSRMVKIVSTGWAEAKGVGKKNGDVSYMEAVYSAGAVTTSSTTTSTSDILATGAAMYSYGSASISGSSNIGSDASIFVKNGDATYYGASNTSNDWIVPKGTLSITGATNFTGHIWAKTVVKSGANNLKYVNVGTAPTAPAWIDFSYTKSDWVGFTEKKLTDCTITGVKNAVAGFGSTPGIVDARSCSGGVDGSLTLTMKNDLVILANKFSLSGAVTTAGSRLWLITPDTTANHDVNCPGSFSAVSFSANPVMIYTPCVASFDGAYNLGGQIFAGGISMNGAFNIGYVPVGLPGYDLSDGTTKAITRTTTTSTDTQTDKRTLVTSRNVNGG